MLIRILILSAYVPFTKNIFLIIQTYRNEEKMQFDIKSEFQQLTEIELNFEKLISIRTAIQAQLYRIFSRRKLTSTILIVITYLTLNLFLILTKRHDWDKRLMVLFFTNLSALLWGISHLIQRFKDFRKLKKIKSWIIPSSLMIVNFLLLSEGDLRLFLDITGILMIWLFPIVLIIFFTTNKQKKLEYKLNEIEKIILKRIDKK